jgi:hypothetical protein
LVRKPGKEESRAAMRAVLATAARNRAQTRLTRKVPALARAPGH